MKKDTTESFIEKAREVHGDRYDYHKVNYVNKRTKVCIICPVHGEFFQFPPNHIRLKQGCPECGKKKAMEYVHNNLRLSLEDFILKAKQIHGDKYDYSLISEYKDNKTLVTVKCNECGKIFEIKPNGFLSGHGCPKCNRKKKVSASDILYNCEHSQYGVYGVSDIDQDKTYRLDDKLTVICEKHGKHTVSVKKILNGNCCPECAKERKANGARLLSKIEVSKRLEELVGNSLTYDIKEYVNTSKSITLTCNTCGKTFKRSLNALQTNSTCPHCNKEKTSLQRTKTTEQYISECEERYGDQYDYSETQYVGSDQKVTVKCNQCGKTFSIEANSHLQGHGCPYHNCNSSKIEKEIAEYIKGLIDGEVVTNYRGNKEIMELDIYIPSYNIGIELNGLYWHNELNKPKDYHLQKTIACENNGIRLFHIFEDEWIYKKDIIKSMIRNMFGKNEQSIMARKCEIKSVSSHDASVFLDNNHLQGKCGSTIRYGLFYNGDLVSIMTFGKSRHFIGNGKTEWELLRFCNKLNTNIAGAASKLLKHFISEHNPNEIVSYADRRWSEGKLYNVLGFELYNKSNPNYYYIISGKRYNRFNFRKSVLVEKYNCPTDISEHDFCLSQKWYRIYDCGCLCYKWKKIKI